MTDLGSIAERAAFLEHCEGLPKVAAETKAIREALGQAHGARLPGILGELITAGRRRHEPGMDALVTQAGLANGRQPTWGIAMVVAEGYGYRPAQPLERRASPAIIVPVSSLWTGLIDLVAQGLTSGRMAGRRGVAEVVGLDEVDRARETEQPLLIFDDVVMWLRAGTRGAVVVDWKRAGAELEGVTEIRTTCRLAPRLHAITRRCWPLPKIAVPTGGAASHVV